MIIFYNFEYMDGVEEHLTLIGQSGTSNTTNLIEPIKAI